MTYKIRKLILSTAMLLCYTQAMEEEASFAAGYKELVRSADIASRYDDQIGEAYERLTASVDMGEESLRIPELVPCTAIPALASCTTDETVKNLKLIQDPKTVKALEMLRSFQLKIDKLITTLQNILKAQGEIVSGISEMQSDDQFPSQTTKSLFNRKEQCLEKANDLKTNSTNAMAQLIKIYKLRHTILCDNKLLLLNYLLGKSIDWEPIAKQDEFAAHLTNIHAYYDTQWQAWFKQIEDSPSAADKIIKQPQLLQLNKHLQYFKDLYKSATK